MIILGPCPRRPPQKGRRKRSLTALSAFPCSSPALPLASGIALPHHPGLCAATGLREKEAGEIWGRQEGTWPSSRPSCLQASLQANGKAALQAVPRACSPRGQ